MNDHDQSGFDPRIADWLEADPDSAPDDALRVVLAAVPSIRQPRGLTARWRSSPMQQTTKLVLGMVAVVAIVAGGLYLAGPFSTPSVGSPGSPSPSSAPSPSAAGGTSAPAASSSGGLADEPTILAVTATDGGCSAPPEQLDRGPLPPDAIAWITVTNESSKAVFFQLDKANDAADYETFRLYMQAEHDRAAAGQPLLGPATMVELGASRTVEPGATDRFLAPTQTGTYGVVCLPSEGNEVVDAYLVGPIRIGS